MNKYRVVTDQLADVVNDKNSAYGNSVEKAPQCLAVLYPDGIKVADYQDALFVLRILDKLARISSPHADKEDPVLDIAGYSILTMYRQLLARALKEKPSWTEPS